MNFVLIFFLFSVIFSSNLYINITGHLLLYILILKIKYRISRFYNIEYMTTLYFWYLNCLLLITDTCVAHILSLLQWLSSQTLLDLPLFLILLLIGTDITIICIDLGNLVSFTSFQFYPSIDLLCTWHFGNAL